MCFFGVSDEFSCILKGRFDLFGGSLFAGFFEFVVGEEFKIEHFFGELLVSLFVLATFNKFEHPIYKLAFKVIVLSILGMGLFESK